MEVGDDGVGIESVDCFDIDFHGIPRSFFDKIVEYLLPIVISFNLFP